MGGGAKPAAHPNERNSIRRDEISDIVNLAQRGEPIHRAVSSIVVKRVVELLLQISQGLSARVGLFDAP